MDAAQGGRWAEWVGRTRTVTERLSAAPARGLAATLDRDGSTLAAGAALPPGWHWVYFNEAVPRSGLAPDGHETRGDFLPPVPLERRMWAGGRLRFHRPLRLGEEAERVSTVERVTPKEGRSGSLVFVTVSHRIQGPDGVAIEEEQDLVYRDATPVGEARTRGSATLPVPEGARSIDSFVADAVTLFRFSALTFNAHRIHYDHPYATEVEGYPGLVVHGPLIALLLLGTGARLLASDGGGARLGAYEYRALAPLFSGEPFDLMASRGGDDVRRSVADTGAGGAPRPIRLWAVHAGRGPAMEATVEAAGARASTP